MRTSASSPLLSSQPCLITQQTAELKLALDGTNALTPSQVIVWLFPHVQLKRFAPLNICVHQLPPSNTAGLLSLGL